MTNYIISDDALLKGIRKFQESLSSLTQFKHIEFVEWIEISSANVAIAKLRNELGHIKVLIFENKYQDDITHFIHALNSNLHKVDSIRTGREELIAEAIKQVNDNKWIDRNS